jgi:hypothetical protein
MSRFPWLLRRWRSLVPAIIALATLSIVAVLVPSLGTTALTHSERIVRSHERLHFSLHLAAGRALSVCPCTRSLASIQYEKAATHAPTPGERWLVTTGRPQRLLDGPRDLVTLTRYAGWIAVSSSEARGTLALVGSMLILIGLGFRRRLSRREADPRST